MLKNKQPKKTQTRAKKEELVKELTEKVGKAKALVFANYQGLTHKQLEELKRQVRTVNAELVVCKNSLLKIALNLNHELGIRNKEKDQNPDSLFMLPDSNLEGPTATLFAYDDVILPLKALAKTIKQFQLPIIKFGIIEKVLLAKGEIERLSTLPPKEVLVAQVVGGIKSPLFGLHRALNWNIQRLALTLKAIEAKKV